MDLPIALDVTLKALLSCHSVQSWKIATEGQNPTVILRLRPETQQSACHKRVDTGAFKRKPPSQILRDRRRVEEYRQKRDQVENTAVPKSRFANQSEKTIENVLTTETVNKDPSENDNEFGDGDSLHTSQMSATDTTQRGARGDAEETPTRDESGGHNSEMETETNGESDTDTESESDQQANVKETDTWSDQPLIDTARVLAKNADLLHIRPEILRNEKKDKFTRIVLDWRGRDGPKLLCISEYVVATCNISTGKSDFEIRDPEDRYLLHFWHHWPEVDRGGAHKEKIAKIETEMEEIWNRVREMM